MKQSSKYMREQSRDVPVRIGVGVRYSFPSIVQHSKSYEESFAGR